MLAQRLEGRKNDFNQEDRFNISSEKALSDIEMVDLVNISSPAAAEIHNHSNIDIPTSLFKNMSVLSKFLSDDSGNVQKPIQWAASRKPFISYLRYTNFSYAVIRLVALCLGMALGGIYQVKFEKTWMDLK